MHDCSPNEVPFLDDGDTEILEEKSGTRQYAKFSNVRMKRTSKVVIHKLRQDSCAVAAHWSTRLLDCKHSTADTASLKQAKQEEGSWSM